MAAAVTSAARQAPARGGSAKTSPPELPRDYVNRARLLDRLDAALSRRLTTVVAGPGYGKTTLLAAWAAHHGAAWYTVDSRDRSLGRFARGLSDTLGLLRAPELGQPGSDTRADALAELLCEAVATCLEADTALILDDVRELSAKRASARLLETLCRQAPEQLHVVIGSRREPPFPIQRLRGRGHVLSIDADALALTPFTVLTKSLPDGDYALVTRINVDFELTMDDGDGYCQLRVNGTPLDRQDIDFFQEGGVNHVALTLMTDDAVGGTVSVVCFLSRDNPDAFYFAETNARLLATKATFHS